MRSMDTHQQFVLSNARIVQPCGITAGSLVVVDGLIDKIDESAHADGVDCGGDYLLPGLVELHTDHLETHYSPRPGVRWNPLAAIQAHDAQVATSGITTVLDCLRMGTDDSADYEPGEMLSLADTLQSAASQNRLRSEHFLHLRCEVSAPNALDDFRLFESHPNVRMVSLMDHAPGQRQFKDMAVFEHYHRNKDGMDNATFQAFAARRQTNSELFSATHRASIAQACQERGIALASHDDATLEHVEESQTLGIQVAEFPTTAQAAEAAHEIGMKVLMGAPNVVRGQSHSGNVAARDLARRGTLDVLSSDYVPSSLLLAVFVLSLQDQLMSLSEATSLVSQSPAHAIGLTDRGQLSAGKRADLIRVSYSDGVPTVKTVWREGLRVA